MGGARLSLVGAIAPKRRALMVPLTADGMVPGAPPYEALVRPLRSEMLAVFGLTMPFGVLSERAIMLHPEIIRVGRGAPERLSEREARARIRAWMDTEGPTFERIVLLSYGPMMPVWSRAVQGSAAAPKVKLVQVHRRGGLGDTVLARKLKRAVQE